MTSDNKSREGLTKCNPPFLFAECSFLARNVACGEGGL